MTPQVSIVPREKTLARHAIAIAAGVVLYVLLEATVFASGWYAQVLEPDSLGGAVRLRVMAERAVAPDRLPRIAVLGNSRLAEGFSAKLADEVAAGRASFANLASAGTSPRAWYYILRAADPDARKFHAVVIQTELYADEDGDTPLADDISDLHAAGALLRLSDAVEFPSSYSKPRLKLEALRGTLLRGYAFKHDIQSFLEHPFERIKKVRAVNAGHAAWTYSYEGRPESLAGMTVDWSRGQLSVPSSTSPEIVARLRRVLFRNRSPQTGRQTEYRERWFGRIIERCRAAGTRVVFVRVPRGPAVHPDSDPRTLPSTIRHYAQSSRATAIRQEAFLPLETPDYFWDEYHMNASGRRRFSEMLVRELDQAGIL